MTSHDLRRAHLISICHALTTYLENDNRARIKTITDEDSLTEAVEALRGQPAIIFTIEDWEAFRAILEPGSGLPDT